MKSPKRENTANNDRCVLEYIANEIEIGIREETIDRGRRPIDIKCLSCTKETRCDFYLPFQRINHPIRSDQILYRRKYRKNVHG